VIITNARVWTGDPTQPTAGAVAVRGNRIAFVGSAEDVGGWRGPGTRVIDAGGHTLTPGIIDAHFHLLYGCLYLASAQLYEAHTPGEAQATLRAHAGAHPERSWVEGRGLRYGVISHRQQLDAVEAERPVYVVAYDGHTAWANTRALELAGILHGGDVIGPNSVIGRDEHGVATGELAEAGAMELVRRLIPDVTEAEKRRLLQTGIAQINRAGVTSVHNMDGTLDQLELYKGLEADGALNLRVYMPFHVKPDTPFDGLREAAEMARVPAGLARGGAAKFFMDGVLESWTALMVAPYADRPDSHGDALWSLEDFVEFAAECDRMGLQIHVHCCGDGAVRRTLDGYEAIQARNGRRDSRHRVEHIEVIHPDDLPRFKQLGVLGSVQPLHAPTLTEGDIWITRAGPARWPLSFAWRTLKNNGVHLAYGSDWPVVSYDPMLGIWMGLTRQPWQAGDPDQRLTLDELLAGYTRDAAYFEFKEDEKGQLKRGYLADLVLHGADLFQTDPALIGSTQPALTMVNGKVVFENL
jgi:hypothetical protein